MDDPSFISNALASKAVKLLQFRTSWLTNEDVTKGESNTMTCIESSVADIFESKFSLKLPFGNYPDENEETILRHIKIGVQHLAYLHDFTNISEGAQRLLENGALIILHKMLSQFKVSLRRRKEQRATAFKSPLQHMLYVNGISPVVLQKTIICTIYRPAKDIARWWNRFNKSPEARAEIFSKIFPTDTAPKKLNNKRIRKRKMVSSSNESVLDQDVKRTSNVKNLSLESDIAIEADVRSALPTRRRTNQKQTLAESGNEMTGEGSDYEVEAISVVEVTRGGGRGRPKKRGRQRHC